MVQQATNYLKIELNGGLNTPNDCLKALETFDGAMVGRAAYSMIEEVADSVLSRVYDTVGFFKN